VQFSYKTKGVCSRAIHLDIENDIVKSVRFEGGCAGNTKGVSILAQGMKVDEVITRLEGIKCGFKGTSCPDQLAEALKSYKENQE